jgi:tRNA threonylcarbamoyladenosine biosynthesis protein TsaE
MSGPTLLIEGLDAVGLAALGRRLGELLFPGATVALTGPLGAGKTFLARAVAEGLGVRDVRAVNSPTFVLVQEYQGRLPIYHFDVYRLRSPEEFFDLGSAEYFAGDGVCLVEWADRVERYLPRERLDVTLEYAGEAARAVRMTARGADYVGLVERVFSG